MSLNFDFSEVAQRVVKYIVEGVLVAIAAFLIPQGKTPKMEEVVMLGLTAAAVFAVLDMVAPSSPMLSSSVRQGAGFGLGANLVGFPRA